MERRWSGQRAPARPGRLLYGPAVVSALALAAGGCASPGPPRSPSLQLPRPVQDLAAARVGDTVELHFTVPTRTSDGQPLRGAVVTGTLCRQVAGSGACTPVDVDETRQPLAIAGRGSGPATAVTWTDHLPDPLRLGPPRVVAYKVELRNEAGRSAGPSDAAYAAAGTAPLPVAGLTVQGARTGIALAWSPVNNAGEVLLERTQPVVSGTPKPAPGNAEADRPGVERGHGSAPSAFSHAGERRGHAFATADRHEPASTDTTWLQAAPGDLSAAATIDGTPQPGVSYTYVAVRRQTVTLGGRTLELRSAPSAPVRFAWNDVYPPAAPRDLTALGFAEPPAAGKPGEAPPPPGTYAVDLVWQPVEDTRLAGYRVYRETLNADESAAGSRVLLTPAPVTAPAFHDTTAAANARYRYAVTAVDPCGNESPAATAVVDPTQP